MCKSVRWFRLFCRIATSCIRDCLWPIRTLRKFLVKKLNNSWRLNYDFIMRANFLQQLSFNVNRTLMNWKDFNMHLYNLTLQKASAIYCAVHGQFSGTKAQEIVVSRGKVLEILRPDSNTGKIHPLCSTEVFGTVRDLMAFHLTGGTKGKLSLSTKKRRAVQVDKMEVIITWISCWKYYTHG